MKTHAALGFYYMCRKMSPWLDQGASHVKSSHDNNDNHGNFYIYIKNCRTFSRYNQPKILPCLHSYCKGCLEDMLKTESRDKKGITCPQCKVIHELPPQGIDGYTTFFTINNLLELLHIYESADTPIESIKCTRRKCCCCTLPDLLYLSMWKLPYNPSEATSYKRSWY